MGVTIIDWTIFLCFCALGIQNSYSFVQQMREIEQNCMRDGGYCINTIPPPPPRQRNNNNRRRGGPGAGRMGTRTRKGSRPDPRALGAQHTRLPGSSQGGVAGPPPPGRPAAGPTGRPAAGRPAAGGQAPAYDPAAPRSGQNSPQQANNMFGSNPNDPFSSLFSMMMFTRKKRQVPEPHERPRIRRGQGMYAFLNQHCRKSEFDFGCRKTGGMCCLPFLK